MKRACTLLLSALVALVADADESTPTKPPAPAARCEAPPNMVVREIERLFKSAAEHATHSSACIDGGGERTTIQLLATCVDHGRAPTPGPVVFLVSARYHVTITRESGGRCAPTGECPKPPPPRESTSSVVLGFSGSPDSLRLVVPTALEGVPLKTPLDRAHSTGCYGDSAAFTPNALKR